VQGYFFELFAKEIEKTSVYFSGDQRCGSTLTEVPKDACSICESPVAEYKEVEKDQIGIFQTRIFAYDL
jgi:hypothetical protein